MRAIDALVVSAGPGEARIAMMSAGRVVEFAIDRGELGPGDILAGRVVEVSPALGAAFVEIGDALPAFLAKANGLGVGQGLLVEVALAARAGKGAEVKRAPQGSAPRRRSAFERVFADHPEIASVSVDAASALPRLRTLFPQATLAADCFEESGAADALEGALARRADLAGGGALIFAETEAATLIDIDGGGLAPAAANLAAMPEIARQLRLRAIGGHILIDAIPSRERGATAKSMSVLRAALAGDPAPAQLAGRTPLGMIELTRRRRGPSLAETMLEPSAAAPNPLTLAFDGLRALLREAAARPAAALGLSLPPRAASALRRREDALAETARLLGRNVILVERRELDRFAIEELAR